MLAFVWIVSIRKVLPQPRRDIVYNSYFQEIEVNYKKHNNENLYKKMEKRKRKTTLGSQYENIRKEAMPLDEPQFSVNHI